MLKKSININIICLVVNNSNDNFIINRLYVCLFGKCILAGLWYLFGEERKIYTVVLDVLAENVILVCVVVIDLLV